MSTLVALDFLSRLGIKQGNLSTFVTGDDLVAERRKRSYGGL